MRVAAQKQMAREMQAKAIERKAARLEAAAQVSQEREVFTRVKSALGWPRNLPLRPAV